jgi:hypothetical protein
VDLTFEVVLASRGRCIKRYLTSRAP